MNKDNAKDAPFPSYRGDDPFVFVSYSPEDVKAVFPDIRLFQNQGFNVFYNEDLRSSETGIKKTLPYIEDCEIFIVFVTDNSAASKNIKKEFRTAIGRGKPIVAIHFDDFDNIEMSNGWRYELYNVERVYRRDDEKSYISDVFGAIDNLRQASDVEDEPVFYDDRPKVHVSYFYDDFHLVSREIRRLQNMGCNVSFDEGFKSSSESLKNCLSQIDECELVIAYVTKNSVASAQFCDEFKHAVREKKSILPIYLNDFDKNEISLEIKDDLLSIQCLFKTNFEPGEYTSKLSESLQNFGIIPKDPTNSRLIPGVGREPICAYRGENPYIFISYAHKDSYRVFPEIKRFQDLGYNIWYDEGIAPASEWLEDVVEHLENCDLFIICISKMSIASVNVKKELLYATKREKDILPIFFDDFDELNMNNEWKSLLSDIQGINKAKMGNEEFEYKCCEAFERFEFEPLFEAVRDEVFKKIELTDPAEVLMEDTLANSVLYSDIDCEAISRYVDDFFASLIIYEDYAGNTFHKDMLKAAIDVFLQNSNFTNAFNVYDIFFSIYQFSSAAKSTSDVSLAESNNVLDLIGEFAKYRNDEFIHSVNVFILGLAIHCQNGAYRSMFAEYVKSSGYEKYYQINGDLTNEEFLLRWGIASLMHDICRPFEIYDSKVNSILYEKFDKIMGIDRSIGSFSDLNEIYKSNPYFDDDYMMRHGETKFIDLFKPTDILAHRISLDFDINVNQAISSLNSFMDFIIENQYEEHGFLSSLIVLNLYAYQIQESGKDSSFFYYPIADSASAILLHNYYRYFMQKNPFNLNQLKPIQSPITYLLILCDTMLEFYKRPETVTDDNINVLSDFQITDDKFNATYIVNSSSYGFGFYNELFLDDVLDVSYLFNGGMSVESDSDNIKSNAGIFRPDFELNDYLIRNLERVAIESHNGYVEGMIENGMPVEENFERLPGEMKLAYIRQAKAIFKNLARFGYEIATMDDEREAQELSDEEILHMAIGEHESYFEEKEGTGWTYARQLNRENKTTPYLVQWGALHERPQDIDMEAVKRIPGLFDALGFKVVLSRKRLLSLRVYDESTKLENCESFDSLSLPIKEMHYKNTDLIIETLSKLDYNVVDKFYGGEGVESFSNDEIRYFAQVKHEKWFRLKSSLGWKYGEVYDEESKTDPNLLSWQNLNIRYAILQMNVFENLPEFCDEAGLKITKNTIDF